MRVLPLSDLHLEFVRTGATNFLADLGLADADVLLVAGDLCGHFQLELVLKHLCERYPHVIFVPGNHDYYASSFGTVRGLLTRVQGELSNLHWLDNESVRLGGLRFVGTTLWFPPGLANELYKGGLSDFMKIESFGEAVYEENRAAVEFLRSAVKPGDVVITHHLPCFASVPERFRGPLTRFYWTDLEELIVERRPALWIHGHIHVSCDYLAAGTRVVCNPHGYPDVEENPAFDPQLLIEVSPTASPGRSSFAV